jgi:hypothetical protein
MLRVRAGLHLTYVRNVVMLWATAPAQVRSRLKTGEPKRAGAAGVSEELGALRGRRDALQARP